MGVAPAQPPASALADSFVVLLPHRSKFGLARGSARRDRRAACVAVYRRHAPDRADGTEFGAKAAPFLRL
jgi:hypothetical protein